MIEFEQKYFMTINNNNNKEMNSLDIVRRIALVEILEIFKMIINSYTKVIFSVNHVH